jgi:hypothetical protein
MYHTPSSFPFIRRLQEILVEERALQEEISALDASSAGWSKAVAPLDVGKDSTPAILACGVFQGWVQLETKEMQHRLQHLIPKRIEEVCKQYENDYDSSDDEEEDDFFVYDDATGVDDED